MSETMKHTKEPYEVARLKNADNHDEMIAYVSKCIRTGGNDFYFISQKGIEGEPDICHVGNGPKSVINAQRIVLCINICSGLTESEIREAIKLWKATG